MAKKKLGRQEQNESGNEVSMAPVKLQAPREAGPPLGRLGKNKMASHTPGTPFQNPRRRQIQPQWVTRRPDSAASNSGAVRTPAHRTGQAARGQIPALCPLGRCPHLRQAGDEAQTWGSHRDGCEATGSLSTETGPCPAPQASTSPGPGLSGSQRPSPSASFLQHTPRGR